MNSLNAEAWFSLSSDGFEELIFWLLQREGFFNLAWRDRGAGKGRDVVCQRTELLGTKIVTHDCVVRCRPGRDAVDREALGLAVTEAARGGFDYFVLATTAALDDPTRDGAGRIASEHGSRVVFWGRSDLETLLAKHQDLRFKFLAMPLAADFLLRQLTEDGSHPPMTPIAAAVLEEACAIALEDDQSVTVAHIFVVMLQRDVDCTCKLISKLGGDLAIVRENLISIILEQPEATAHEYGLIVSNSVRQAVGAAVEITEVLEREEISESVLLLAMIAFKESYSIEASLKSVNIDFAEFLQALLSTCFTESEAAAFEGYRKERQKRAAGRPQFHTFDTRQLEIGGVLRQISKDPRKR